MKKMLLCIDDTDNLESIGTGELLERLSRGLHREEFCQAGFVSRHQLLVHEDIPYTSHNSSMCVDLYGEEYNIRPILEWSRRYLKENAAEGSDPGLCLVLPERMNPEEQEILIQFGLRAKEEVLSKKLAYELAEAYPEWVFLSEHGGTGGGVIGALAGCGLRLFGKDGRIKGKIRPENPGEVLTVETFCQTFGVSKVLTEEFKRLPETDWVTTVAEIKPILWDHEKVVLVEPLPDDEGQWIVITKKALNQKRIGR